MLGLTVHRCAFGNRCMLLSRLKHITFKAPVCCFPFTLKNPLPKQYQSQCNYSTRGEIKKLAQKNLSLYDGIVISEKCSHGGIKPYTSVFVFQSCSFSTGESKVPDEKPPEKLSLFQKFKQMYRDYWYVLVPVHLITSLAWFGGFYYLAVSGVDIVGLLESWGVSEKLINPLRDSHAGYIAVAYALYKIFTPLRYTVTLGGTTISIKYLKEWGYIKPMPAAGKLKEMYQEKKELYQGELRLKQENLKKRKDNIIRGYQDRASNKPEK